MKTIRKNVFETNSSSCHVITFSDEQFIEYPFNHIDFTANGEYEWSGPDVRTPEEKADYYMVAYIQSLLPWNSDNDPNLVEKLYNEYQKHIETIKEVFSKKGITTTFYKPEFEKTKWGIEVTNSDFGNIDHQSGPFESTECAKLANFEPNELLDWLSSPDAYVLIRNDNTDYDDDF